MSVTNTKSEGASIVVLGNLNPAIFTPLWFKTFDLVPHEECDAASNIALTNDFACFELPWCRIQVFNDRFIIETTDSARVVSLADLVVGTFSLLEHSPIISFGFNRFFHVQLESEENWNKIGHLLAPKSIWEEVIPNPRTRTVSIRGEKQRKDGLKGSLQARFEPSSTVQHGVFFEVHRNYTIDEEKTDSEVQQLHGKELQLLRQTLQDKWPDFLLESDKITNHVLAKFRASLSE